MSCLRGSLFKVVDNSIFLWLRHTVVYFEKGDLILVLSVEDHEEKAEKKILKFFCKFGVFKKVFTLSDSLAIEYIHV